MEMIILVTDIVEKAIMLLMLGLSIWSFTIMIDRNRLFKNIDLQSCFENLKSKILSSEFEVIKKDASTDFLTRGMNVILKADKKSESIDRALSSFIKEEKIKIEKGLAVLGTLGANAPFIGLFGTVLGIIRSFAYLGSQSGSSAVMSGVSQALYATAMGLFVAIPAVISYNIFQKKIKDLTSKLESLRDLYISKL